jgi:hypothetical protein
VIRPMSKNASQAIRPAEQACSRDRKLALATIIARLKELRLLIATTRLPFNCKGGELFAEHCAVNGLTLEYTTGGDDDGVYFCVFFEGRRVMTGCYGAADPPEVKLMSWKRGPWQALLFDD